MNQEDLLIRLARLARQEAPPAIRVSDRVVRRIPLGRPTVDVPLAVLAGASAAAAVIVLVYAAHAWSAWQDPITGLLFSMNMVLT